MPSGRKGKNKQRRRRKQQKQLLERSRRSRDEQVNTALEETDVIAHLPHNGSFLHKSAYIATKTLEYDLLDGADDEILPAECSLFVSPAKSLSSSCFISTPKKSINNTEFGIKKSKRSLSSPSSVTTVFLSPISSKGEQCVSDDSSSIITRFVELESDNFWLRAIKYTQHLVSTVPNFFSRICSWVKILLTTFKHASYKVNTTQSIEFLKEVQEKRVREEIIRNDVLMEKLNTVLAVVSRLEEKHDTLMARVAALEHGVERLKLQPVTSVSSAAPPPPPPLPPPAPACDVATPATHRPASKPVLRQAATPRPSITLQDILSVQLKKTPAQRPIDKTCQLNGSRGPLVSVDMLRAVKLKPSQLRRRSLERPLQSPSAVFKIRSP